jgi:fucose permease
MTSPAVAEAPAAFQRTVLTWFCYLTLAFFTFVLNIQGNILPFLKTELDLTYRILGLHSSAVATGMIVAGIVGDRVIGLLGRRGTMMLALAGIGAGSLLLAWAPSSWFTIAGCFLIGALGGLTPGTVLATLSDTYGDSKDIAFAECMATCYAFAILAPLSSSLAIAMGLGWRAALFFGLLLGALILVLFGRASFPAPAASRGNRQEGSLPVAFWVYWFALCMSVAVEFCIILWAPEYLERVAGFTRTEAAGWAATFFLAMLIGRLGGAALIRVLSRDRLFAATVAVALAGFAVYWTSPGQVAAVAGLFLLGLGVSQLYPVGAGAAIASAGGLGERAGTRLTIAVGIAILTMPALLGALADLVGLHLAHLVMPVLAAASGIAFLAAGRLMRTA